MTRDKIKRFEFKCHRTSQSSRALRLYTSVRQVSGTAFLIDLKNFKANILKTKR